MGVLMGVREGADMAQEGAGQVRWRWHWANPGPLPRPDRHLWTGLDLHQPGSASLLHRTCASLPHCSPWPCNPHHTISEAAVLDTLAWDGVSGRPVALISEQSCTGLCCEITVRTAAVKSNYPDVCRTGWKRHLEGCPCGGVQPPSVAFASSAA